MALVIDVGMYDGADTAYYLSMGYRVLAVEANPALVAQPSTAARVFPVTSENVPSPLLRKRAAPPKRVTNKS